MNSLCNRCKEKFHCYMNYDGKPCRKNRNVEPSNFDLVKDMEATELADFLSFIENHELKVGDAAEWLSWLEKPKGKSIYEQP